MFKFLHNNVRVIKDVDTLYCKNCTSFMCKLPKELIRSKMQTQFLQNTLRPYEEVWLCINFRRNEHGQFKVCEAMTWDDAQKVTAKMSHVVPTGLRNIIFRRNNKCELSMLCFRFLCHKNLQKIMIKTFHF